MVDPTVFTCVSMLAKAVGPPIVPDVKELLEPMLAVGLRSPTFFLCDTIFPECVDCEKLMTLENPKNMGCCVVFIFLYLLSLSTVQL